MHPYKLQEVTHVPGWVKAMMAAGLVLFAVQLSSFESSLADTVKKRRADNAFNSAQYLVAVALYKDLHDRYPADRYITRFLGFSYHRSGAYAEAVNTFNQLVGTKLGKKEIDEINRAMADMASKLAPK